MARVSRHTAPSTTASPQISGSEAPWPSDAQPEPRSSTKRTSAKRKSLQETSSQTSKPKQTKSRNGPTDPKKASVTQACFSDTNTAFEENEPASLQESVAAASEPVVDSQQQQSEQTQEPQSCEQSSLVGDVANHENLSALADCTSNNTAALDYGTIPQSSFDHYFDSTFFSYGALHHEPQQSNPDHAELPLISPMSLPLVNFGKSFATNETCCNNGSTPEPELANETVDATQWIAPSADNFLLQDVLTQQSSFHDMGSTFHFAHGKNNGWPSNNAFSSFNLFSQPRLSIDSHEQLLGKFLHETCGIMCIRTEPDQNPWWSLISPLVNENPALYHAIASMACFHQSKSVPKLRQSGMRHVSQSVQELRRGSKENRPSDEIVMATYIALAFSESWNTHTSTGIDHIKCAKEVMGLVMSDENGLRRSNQAHLELLRFLCKTWLYIDVIARLTSMDTEVSDDFEHVATMLFSPLQKEAEVDPLMGCATTLFPVIGRVANLAREVCQKDRKSPAMTEKAQKLKIALENWTPSSSFVDVANSGGGRDYPYHHHHHHNHHHSSQDYKREIGNSLLTAEAYRWATILHLYQAVPEVQGLPSPTELARRTLNLLANVSSESGTVIVQIYPLLVAGCEVTSKEDRDWVVQRWKNMSSRMCIGNVDRCADVVTEVWRRRDEHASRSERADVFAAAAAAAPAEGEEDFMSLTDFGPDFLKQLAPPRSLDRYMSSNSSSSSSSRSKSTVGSMAPARASSSHSSLQTRYTKSAPSAIDLNPPCGSGLAPDLTIRGHLHWVGVMRDWKWEGT
ncbi:MAG: hypothetical protein M1831_006312 [Alyxoria varia]|nr:MAG: hypothetical protein M1831_006312 [Alyxoria varia]